MDEAKKKHYAELLKQRQEAEKQQQAEAERREQERRRLDELTALQQESKSGNLSEIVEQFGEGTVPPAAPEDRPQKWPKGVDKNQRLSMFVDQESLTDAQVTQLRENMEDHYPTHCELHEYTTVSGKRAVLIVGVTAEEVVALKNMMIEKSKLETSLGQDRNEPSQGRNAPPELKNKIAEALNPEVAPPSIETENSPSPTPKRAGQKIKQLV